jgi:glycosyltransferase involved in cell wall biosynthesis
MRIGIDIRNIGKKRTGDETVFFNLVKNLAEIDNSNKYLLFTDIADITVLQYAVKKLNIENKNNFEIVSLRSANKFIWNLWTLPQYLKKNPVDVYHTQYVVPFFVSKKIKIVTHIHDVSFNAYPELISKKDLFFLKILIPWSLKRADRIIAISEFTKKEIIKYYSINPEKIEVVYNAISDDFSVSDFSPEILEEVRRRYNLPENFILYVGTMQPRKNIPRLIETFSIIKNKIPEIKLVLVGDRSAHNFDKKIDEAISKNNIRDSIIFPGYINQEDIAEVYNLSRIFVFPSLYEGFGIPILEAMSQKIPVLLSDIPVNHEIAKDAGLYFNSESLDEISEKLYNSLTDENLRNKLKDLGFQRVKFFSWKKSAEKLLEIYKKFN